MKQEFIEKYYMDKEVTIDIGGKDLYKGIAAECADGVLSLKWTKGGDEYTHIDIAEIKAIWKTKND